MALSVAFLPMVYRNCWMGWKAWKLSISFHEFMLTSRPIAADLPHGHLPVARRLHQHLGQQGGRALSPSINIAIFWRGKFVSCSSVMAPIILYVSVLSTNLCGCSFIRNQFSKICGVFSDFEITRLVGKRARNNMRVARRVRNHRLPSRPSPSLPKDTEVLRCALPLRAHVPVGEGEEEGCSRHKTQGAIGDLAVSIRRGQETPAEQGIITYG